MLNTKPRHSSIKCLTSYRTFRSARSQPGQDKFRPTQATPVENFFLAGSYTYQDYLDSMEGATRSGLMVADEIIARADGPQGLKAMSDKAKDAAVA